MRVIQRSASALENTLKQCPNKISFNEETIALSLAKVSFTPTYDQNCLSVTPSKEKDAMNDGDDCYTKSLLQSVNSS